MTLKLEVGKKYRNRDGYVVKIVTQYEPDEFYEFRDVDGRHYSNGGQYHMNATSRYDLIEEVIEPVKKPHKHAELIKAWADGAEIQILGRESKWIDISMPCWEEFNTFRIKPEPKPDVVVRFYTAQSYGHLTRVAINDEDANLKLIWDGETGNLKDAEVLK